MLIFTSHWIRRNLSPKSKIWLLRDRERQREAPISDSERQQLRAVLGSLSWFTGQTGFHNAADVGILLSSVATGTVEDLIRANKLVRDIKKNPGTGV